MSEDTEESFDKFLEEVRLKYNEYLDELERNKQCHQENQQS